MKVHLILLPHPVQLPVCEPDCIHPDEKYSRAYPGRIWPDPGISDASKCVFFFPATTVYPVVAEKQTFGKS